MSVLRSLVVILTMISHRCGEGLMSLFNSPAVQSFLNGIELKAAKAVYQPGSLRKV